MMNNVVLTFSQTDEKDTVRAEPESVAVRS